MILAGLPSWVVLQHVPAIVFVFAFGACAGSFLNVVIHRLPAGMSVISPPSRCPACGVRLRFFRENLPILGWLLVRGRCRACGSRVGPHYMLIELAVALGFTALYALLYLPGRDSWLHEIGGAWWTANGFFRTWPAFFALCILGCSLAAMTVIDARTFTIPIQIPQFATGAGLVLWTVQALLPHRHPSALSWPIPGAGWTSAGAALGGALGVVLSCVLLWFRVLKPSFADYEDYVAEGETLADYPHARREMRHELAFTAPIVVGAALGGWLLAGAEGVPSPLVQALAASCLGSLVGGGLVWAIRILGTLAFGREAMGMGDVHLLGAVGAVLGPWDPVVAFFLAPFLGLAWVLAARGVAAATHRRERELPYGPHLAAATVIAFLARPAIDRAFDAQAIPHPRRGLVAEAAPDASRPLAPAARPPARPAPGP